MSSSTSTIILQHLRTSSSLVVFNTTEEFINHAHVPMEGRRHECTLYMRIGLDKTPAELLSIEGTKYLIHGY